VFSASLPAISACQTVALETWKRREHFEFFSAMDEPFHSVVVNLECTALMRQRRAESVTFFLGYLHKILQAANATAAFRLRTDGTSVVDYECIHANVTVSRPDHTFGFCAIAYVPDLNEFAARAAISIAKVKAAKGLCLDANGLREDMIHLSVLPDIRFTGLSHATRFGTKSSVPKISVGQCFEQHGQWWMPLAVSVHHAVVDGYDVGQFLSRLQTLYDAVG
jgi:chloramphenicol O-acetyltransferase type A